MPAPLNLTNQRFGKLVAIKPTNERKSKSVVWECKCDCGKIFYTSSKSLRGGRTNSCGCLRKWNNMKDISNQRFGKLVAIKPTEMRKNNSIVWECKCDCGNICYVDTHSLNRGNTQSCGCLKSKGEMKILQILQKMNIDFEYQKTFETCKLEKELKFDFYINSLNLIIEYDGEQHFHPIEFLGGEKRFKEQQFYDNYKNNWCKDNNIHIIRIPYTDLNILNEKYIEDIIKDIKENK